MNMDMEIKVAMLEAHAQEYDMVLGFEKSDDNTKAVTNMALEEISKIIKDSMKHPADLSKAFSQLAQLQNILFAAMHVGGTGSRFYLRWRDSMNMSDAEYFNLAKFVAATTKCLVITEIGRCRVDILP